MKDVPLDDVDFGSLEEHMLQNQCDNLPWPCAPKVPLHKSYKMQIAAMKSSMTHCVVLKQCIFPEKTSLRNVNEIAHGTVHVLDYTPNYRVGPLAVQCMLKKMSHWFAHYTQLIPKARAGPERSMCGLRLHQSSGTKDQCNVYAKPDQKYPLTLRDRAGWFLDEAIATCFPEYLILKDDVESEYSAGFRICSSLDQLRGESGLKYRPGSYRREVDEDAEKGTPEDAIMTVNFKTFLEMTAPAFPEKASADLQGLDYVWLAVNSWLPFLHMINLLRLGRSFSSITDEVLAGYGNIARQTLAKRRDVYQKALECSLTNLDARMIGGKHQVVVRDEAMAGVCAE
eukprot:s375_g10.t2